MVAPVGAPRRRGRGRRGSTARLWAARKLPRPRTVSASSGRSPISSARSQLASIRGSSSAARTGAQAAQSRSRSPSVKKKSGELGPARRLGVGERDRGVVAADLLQREERAHDEVVAPGGAGAVAVERAQVVRRRGVEAAADLEVLAELVAQVGVVGRGGEREPEQPSRCGRPSSRAARRGSRRGRRRAAGAGAAASTPAARGRGRRSRRRAAGGAAASSAPRRRPRRAAAVEQARDRDLADEVGAARPRAARRARRRRA